MTERVSDMAQWGVVLLGNVVLLVIAAGIFKAWMRAEWGRAVTFLVFGCAWAAAVYLGPDFFLGHADEIDSATKKPADHKSDDDGFGFPLWLLFAVVGCAVSVGIAAVAAPIVSRRRRRKAAQRERVAATLDRRRAIEADHDEVREAYGRYAADVLAFLDRPALDDVTVPTTARFHHAMDAAEDARRGEDLAAYREAVSILKTAWRAADEHARKTGVRHLPKQERATISKARALLERALDGAGGEHERHAAYAKARELLDGILVIPRQAAAELESRHRLTLTKAES
ncbi:DUF2786 domain-containing protein [Streptomyces sp. NBC_00078]|uniref:DUF2786 domain-containing protein n=1 Tax=Streptomyces sp. NBC_00078 TaxID=2975643 RepID=UPI002254D500|nr:DUF2786 domain-containing protein [Streptomyces sp. NBC_00078]MCX5426118.1 DUF2786 domain-containing protein [Streptomyces sp. NBC_00078]